MRAALSPRSPTYSAAESNALSYRDLANPGGAGRVLTRGGCEMKGKASVRARLPETEVEGP